MKHDKYRKQNNSGIIIKKEISFGGIIAENSLPKVI